MATAYRIVDWQQHFEKNRTRELVSMTWVPFPNKHDGDGYTELLDHQDGAAHFGAWCALVQVASKCAPRGVLVRDSPTGLRGHDPASLSRMTRIPAWVFEAAIGRLLSIGWIASVELDDPEWFTDIPQDDAALGKQEPQADAASRAGARGEKKREEEKREQDNKAALPPALDVPAFRDAWQDWFAYRRESKLVTWKPRTIEAKLAELATWGPTRATAAIRQSIGNGWKGIFEPKNGHSHPQIPVDHRPPPPEMTEADRLRFSREIALATLSAERGFPGTADDLAAKLPAATKAALRAAIESAPTVQALEAAWRATVPVFYA